MFKRLVFLLVVLGLLPWTGSAVFAQVDICDDAIEIDGNDVIAGTTFGAAPATEDNDFNCGPWNSPGAWFMLLGNGGETTVTTCSGNLSSYDTALSVFTGECDDLVCIGSNDDNCASFRTDSTVSWLSGVDEIYYILVHGWDISTGDFTLTSSQLEPGVVANSPNGFIQAKAWNMLFPVLNPAGCGGGGVEVMSQNWVAPHDLAEEDPKAGDEWLDIDFNGASPGSGFDNGGLSDGPIWITKNFVSEALQVNLTGGDLVDFQQMCVELTNANVGGPVPNDNVMAISTTYVENTTDEPMRVFVCSASDDSVRVDVNNHTSTLVSACRGSAVVCQEVNCSELLPGINKITAYVWEGGGGWRMAIGLMDDTMQPITDNTEGIVFHGADEDGDLESQQSDEAPDCTMEGINPFGWLRTEAWNMLYLDQDGGAAVPLDRMAGNWVAPYEMSEENPRPGEEWDIEFFDAESTGWGGFVVNALPTWFSVASMDDEGIPLTVGDLVDFNAIATQVGFGSNDNIMSISTTYVENTTDALMRVQVCTASDDSIRVDVNDYTVTLVSASRGSAPNCQETRCADLEPGINKITAYVWEGGGGWNMRISLRDQNGVVLTDASDGVIFHGTGDDDGLEGQFIDEPPVDCVEAGPPPPPNDDGYENVGPNGFATQSSEGWGGNPQRGIDGDTNGQWGGGSITHTDQLDGTPSWWEVDLQDTYYISYMRIWNRLDCCSERLTNFTITVLDFEREVVWEETFLPNNGQITGSFLPIEDVESEGQYIRVSLPGQYLSIAELEIFQPTGPPPPPDEICDNGIDDDEDGAADCDDTDCSEAESCQEPAGPIFVRGDGNSDGSINLTDGVIPLLYLFSGGAAPACADAADTNDTGAIEITDAIIIFSWLFSGGDAPVSPSPSGAGYVVGDCGEDVTADDSGCLRTSPVCE
ncbi:MAG: discoidin domain-containing protein [Planctomycetota bacterium]|nr:discoidin domain-containing protein [Planctomycetota bacterium]